MLYKLDISYNGTQYSGWQIQTNQKNTVQQILKSVLYKYFSTSIESFYGLSRTDKGVHAKGQVAVLKTKNCISIELDSLNVDLPNDIQINSIEKIQEDQLPISVKYKTYLYKIANNTNINCDDVYKHWEYIDFQLIKAVTSYFIGKKDFSAFTTNRKADKNYYREIYSIEINQQNDVVEIVFKGNGFLKYMIRMIIKLFIDYGTKRINMAQVENSFKDMAIKKKAPSKGLTLLEIEL